jgi:hypothetical protein
MDCQSSFCELIFSTVNLSFFPPGSFFQVTLPLTVWVTFDQRGADLAAKSWQRAREALACPRPYIRKPSWIWHSIRNSGPRPRAGWSIAEVFQDNDISGSKGRGSARTGSAAPCRTSRRS